MALSSVTLSALYAIIRHNNPNLLITNLVTTVAPRPTAITPEGIPDYHLLVATFVPQAPEKNWDQPWQDACEEAALLTVDYYYQSAVPSLAQIVTRLNTVFTIEQELGFGHDVNMTQLATVANKLGYRSQIIENPTIQQLKTYISQNIPVIVPANGKTLFRENKRFKNGGPWYHQLTILGYDDRRSQFIVHDVGTQFGANFRYSYPTLMASIHDFPDSGHKEDIDQGPPRVLILLK